MFKYLRDRRVWPAIAALLLTACETRHSAATTEAPRPEVTTDSAATVAASVQLFGVADTAEPYPGWYGQPDSARVVQVQLDGKTCYISTAIEIESARQITLPAPAVSANTPPDTLRGPQAHYTIVLRNAQQQPVFTRHLTKQVFADIIHPSYVTEAEASKPSYVGYWPQAHALVFSCGFVMPESDDGISTLLLLDATTGRLLHSMHSNYYGGADLAGEAVLAPTGAVLLTAYALLYPDGRRKSLERRGYDVAGACFINEQTILVDYEPTDVKEGQSRAALAQTVLLNLQGKTLKTLSFSGNGEGGLGYTLMGAYVRQTRTHYFYDERAHALLQVPQDQPLQAKQQPLTALQQFQSPQRATEVKFDFHLESGVGERIILWADTVSGQIRYQRRALSQ